MMHNLLIWDQKLNQSDCCRSRIFFAGVVRNICCDFETMGVMCVVVGLQIVREGEGGGCCRATVPAVLRFHGYCSRDEGREGERAAARVGALGTPAAGLRPRPARGKRFPSNLLLD